MCTALDFLERCHYFGRNLDLDRGYGEEVVVTPRAFPLPYKRGTDNSRHFAFLGTASVADGYPLYFDGTNEHGLSVAALHFVGNTVYLPPISGRENLAPYEVIPRILGSCRTVQEARGLLSKVNLAAIPFREDLPLSELHWLISDRESSLVLEPREEGPVLYDNPIGILTNNPPFPYHREHLREFLNVSAQEPTNRFAPPLTLRPYSKGMGALGLPGDWSSSSRFVRAAFVKWNAVAFEEEAASVSQFFHLLDTVTQTEGCVCSDEARERTRYSSCCNTDRGIYYYKTYENSRVYGVNLFYEELNGHTLTRYPLYLPMKVRWMNGPDASPEKK